MSRARFTTARSVFETFPELASKSAVAATDDPPIVFLKNLSAGGRFEDAVGFCAHLLPRREAVWWGCGSVRAVLGDVTPYGVAGLVAAEAWVHEPTDKNRQAALQIGTRGDSADPLTWLALGAGWSGGMLSTVPNAQVPVPPYLTARAVRIAIQLGAGRLKPAERAERMQTCIAEGIKLAEPGDGQRGSSAGSDGRDPTRRFDTA
jgi:hypothetical protein